MHRDDVAESPDIINWMVLEAVRCYISKADLWMNLALLLEEHWREDAEVVTTFCTVNGRKMETVDCIVESIRGSNHEDPAALLLLATSMRGLTRTRQSGYVLAPRRGMAVVDHVEIGNGRSWTSLECIARALRQKSDDGVRAWRLAGEIQFAEKEISREQLVVNGQSYDMMQCFIKAWLLDRRSEWEKSPELYWNWRHYFSAVQNGQQGVVDGTTYAFQFDEATGRPVGWKTVRESHAV